MIKFKCKDFLLKECAFEAKGTHSVDEMIKLVEVHAGEEHRTLELSPKTIEKIRFLYLKTSRSQKTLGWTSGLTKASAAKVPWLFWSYALGIWRLTLLRELPRLFLRSGTG